MQHLITLQPYPPVSLHSLAARTLSLFQIHIFGFALWPRSCYQCRLCDHCIGTVPWSLVGSLRTLDLYDWSFPTHFPVTPFSNPSLSFLPFFIISYSLLFKNAPSSLSGPPKVPPPSFSLCLCHFLCYFWRHTSVEQCPFQQLVVVPIFFVARQGYESNVGYEQLRLSSANRKVLPWLFLKHAFKDAGLGCLPFTPPHWLCFPRHNLLKL